MNRPIYIAGVASLTPPFPAETDPKTKRLPRVDRIALSVARTALGSTSTENLALVVGTCYGGLAATVDFLEGMAARGPAFGSPTAFHESVHHAPAGQISIALGITGLTLTCSDRELSGETALKTGADLIASGRVSRALIVAAEEIVPALESAFRAFKSQLTPAEAAAAVVLTSEPTDILLESIAVTGRAAGTLRFTVGPRDRELSPAGGLVRIARAVERLRSGVPSALLHSYAQGGGEATVALRRA
jgi:hypothetical protein